MCPVYRRDCEVRQLVVGGFLLVKDLAEQRVRLVMPEVLCPFPQRAVPGNFVVLDCLAGRQPNLLTRYGRRSWRSRETSDPQMLFSCYDSVATRNLDLGNMAEAEGILPWRRKFCAPSTAQLRALGALPFLDLVRARRLSMSTSSVDRPLQPGDRAPNIVLDAISRDGKIALTDFRG